MGSVLFKNNTLYKGCLKLKGVTERYKKYDVWETPGKHLGDVMYFFTSRDLNTLAKRKITNQRI